MGRAKKDPMELTVKHSVSLKEWMELLDGMASMYASSMTKEQYAEASELAGQLWGVIPDPYGALVTGAAVNFLHWFLLDKIVKPKGRNRRNRGLKMQFKETLQ